MEVVSEPDIIKLEQTNGKKIPFNTTKYDIREKYEKLKGKSLFLRFPKKLPVDVSAVEKLAKTLCSSIIKVRRQRQKSSRCCLVDFNTVEDRNEALQKLQNTVINNTKLYVALPKTENNKFLEKIVEKSERRREQKRAKKKLKKEAANAEKQLTTSIIITNIPQEVSLPELHALFPNAIDILRTTGNPEHGKCPILIKFPTPEDAKEVKHKNLVVRGEELHILYDINVNKNKSKQNKITENQEVTNDNNDDSEMTNNDDDQVQTNGNDDDDEKKVAVKKIQNNHKGKTFKKNKKTNIGIKQEKRNSPAKSNKVLKNKQKRAKKFIKPNNKTGKNKNIE